MSNPPPPIEIRKHIDIQGEIVFPGSDKFVMTCANLRDFMKEFLETHHNLELDGSPLRVSIGFTHAMDSVCTRIYISFFVREKDLPEE